MTDPLDTLPKLCAELRIVQENGETMARDVTLSHSDRRASKLLAMLLSEVLMRVPAQAIEARRAVNAEGGAVGDESAVTK